MAYYEKSYRLCLLDDMRAKSRSCRGTKTDELACKETQGIGNRQRLRVRRDVPPMMIRMYGCGYHCERRSLPPGSVAGARRRLRTSLTRRRSWRDQTPPRSPGSSRPSLRGHLGSWLRSAWAMQASCRSTGKIPAARDPRHRRDTATAYGRWRPGRDDAITTRDYVPRGAEWSRPCGDHPCPQLAWSVPPNYRENHGWSGVTSSGLRGNLS
jgi:hypothetical protein